MPQIIGHGLEFHLVVIYIGYLIAVDYLQWNVESTSELDYEVVSNPMGPSGPRSKFIYHDDMIYNGQIDYRSILVHKGVLVTT